MAEQAGRVVKALPPESGPSKSGNGDWRKQSLVIEYGDEYPKKAVFQFWGDKVDQLQFLNEGERVKIHFNPESREYEGRWYTDLKVWKMERLDVGQQPQAPAGGYTNYGAGAASLAPPGATAAIGSSNPNNMDDLPF